MGEIKKVKFLQSRAAKVRSKKLARRDRYDEVFWSEFLQQRSFDSLPEGEERLVTVTIRDEKTGEEWVIEGVRLMKQRGDEDWS